MLCLIVSVFREKAVTTKIVKNLISERICFTDGCNKIGQNTGAKRKDGSIVRRKYCGPCHSKRTAAKHGLTHMGQVIAKNAGYRSLSTIRNKLNCSNIDLLTSSSLSLGVRRLK